MKINTYTPQQPKFTGLSKFQIKVDEKLIRGRAVTHPYRLYKMKQEGITQIIDLRNSSYIERPLERLFCKIFNIKYVNYKYPHRLNYIPNKQFFEKVNNTILSNTEKTYIHCQYGKRRTGICVAVYEKEHTNKTNVEIINNLINFGYKELKNKQKTSKVKKLQEIFDDFMDKYIFKTKPK